MSKLNFYKIVCVTHISSSRFTCILTAPVDNPLLSSATNLLGNTGELIGRAVVDDAIVENPFDVGRKCFSGTVHFVDDVLFNGPQIHGVNY